MTREWYHLGGDPCPIRGDFRGIERSVGLVEQSQSGKYRDDQVVMGKIDIYCSVQWERLRGCEQSIVGLWTLSNGGIRESPDKLVDVPDTLDGAQGASIADKQMISGVRHGGTTCAYPVL